MNLNLLRYSRAALIALGLALLGLNFWLPGGVDFTLPLVFLMLGAGFFLAKERAARAHRWWAWLAVPGATLCAFGLVFLLNVVTGDWSAWAYAWLLLIAGAGLGGLLAGRELALDPRVTLISGIAAAAGLTLFALFGAIVGGPFIQVMAPILLVMGGAGLYFLQPGRREARRADEPPKLDAATIPDAPSIADAAPHAVSPSLIDAARHGDAEGPDLFPGLIEPLTPRERDVLRLLAEGRTNAEIAARLTLAPSTVKTHINNLYGKLGAQGRVDAVNRARALGLLEAG